MPNLGPSITSSPVTAGATDTLYQYQVTASDPEGDTLTFSLSVKPSGMTINASTGLIQYTPTAVSTPNVTVVVTDTASNSASQSYTINVVQRTLSINALVVAGAGAGGHKYGGGGGAGGFFASPARGFIPSIGYAITIGAGGAAAANSVVNGADSKIVANEGSGSATIYQSKGGGGGGGRFTNLSGADGGSGGGGSTRKGSGGGNLPAGDANNSSYNSTGTDGIEGSVTEYPSNKTYAMSGGGGGSSAQGVNPPNAQTDAGRTGSTGGAGTAWLDGTTYAGGGGGSIEQGSDLNYYATGIGAAGGGNGGVARNYFGDFNLLSATSGTANTGSGGGGADYHSGVRGNGGSGVVIIRYAGGTAASGGTISSAGGFTFHKFTSSGTFTPS